MIFADETLKYENNIKIYNLKDNTTKEILHYKAEAINILESFIVKFDYTHEYLYLKTEKKVVSKLDIKN